MKPPASTTILGIETSCDETAAAVLDGEGHLRQLEQIERDLIELAIDHYAGHMSEVARRLGIGRSTLYRKLIAYGIEKPGAGRDAGLDDMAPEAGEEAA